MSLQINERNLLKRPSPNSHKQLSTERIQESNSTHLQKKRRYNATETITNKTKVVNDAVKNNSSTTNRNNSKKKKRFLWSNALHMRFLMAMFDWSMKNIDAKKLSLYLSEEPNINHYFTSGINVKDIESYLKALRTETQQELR